MSKCSLPRGRCSLGDSVRFCESGCGLSSSQGWRSPLQVLSWSFCQRPVLCGGVLTRLSKLTPLRSPLCPGTLFILVWLNLGSAGCSVADLSLSCYLKRSAYHPVCCLSRCATREAVPDSLSGRSRLPLPDSSTPYEPSNS